MALAAMEILTRSKYMIKYIIESRMVTRVVAAILGFLLVPTQTAPGIPHQSPFTAGIRFSLSMGLLIFLILCGVSAFYSRRASQWPQADVRRYSKSKSSMGPGSTNGIMVFEGSIVRMAKAPTSKTAVLKKKGTVQEPGDVNNKSQKQ